MASPREMVRVVIAIDFGTARSGYAFAFATDNNKEVRVRSRWPDQEYGYVKTLTHLLYGPTRRVLAWGCTAMQEMVRLRRDGLFAGHVFVRDFKPALQDGKVGPDGPVWSDRYGNAFPVVDLIADYLRELKTFALNELQAGFRAHSRNAAFGGA